METETGYGSTCENEEEDSSDNFFEAGESAVIGDCLSSSAAPKSGLESGKSGGGTEDDPIAPVTPSAGPTKSGTATR